MKLMKAAMTAAAPKAPIANEESSGRAYRSLLILTAAFALVTGMAEAGLLYFARFQLGRYTHVPLDNWWVAPVGSLMVFSVIALIIATAATVLRRAPAGHIVVFVLALLAAADILLLFTRLHRAALLVLAIGIATQFTSWARRHFRGFLRMATWSIPICAALIVTGGVALHLYQLHAERGARAALPAVPADAPNVVFIIWDTVRAWNVSLYGYPRATTPFLEEWARSGVAFEHAYSTASWTLPSHSSMFTGRYPHELSADYSSPLNSAPRTIAEVFRDHGYETAGFVANTFYCSEESGLSRGFVHYADFRYSAGQLLLGSALVRTVYENAELRSTLGLQEIPGRKTADLINEQFLTWLDNRDPRPFFAFLNFFDAHDPYLPPPPFDTLFGPKDVRRNPVIVETRRMSAQQIANEMNAYDGGIAYMDARLRRLIEELRRRDLYDNTIFIITSDHGEQFGEHGLISHGNSLYTAGLHVPLLIVAPGRLAPGRVNSWVSTRDLAETVRQLAIPESKSRTPGNSLTRLLAGGVGDSLLAEASHNPGLPRNYPVHQGDLQTVLAAPYQLIRNGDGTFELYDLSVDHQAEHNLAGIPAFAPVLQQLRDRLRRMHETDSVAQ